MLVCDNAPILVDSCVTMLFAGNHNTHVSADDDVKQDLADMKKKLGDMTCMIQDLLRMQINGADHAERRSSQRHIATQTDEVPTLRSVADTPCPPVPFTAPFSSIKNFSEMCAGCGGSRGGLQSVAEWFLEIQMCTDNHATPQPSGWLEYERTRTDQGLTPRPSRSQFNETTEGARALSRLYKLDNIWKALKHHFVTLGLDSVAEPVKCVQAARELDRERVAHGLKDMEKWLDHFKNRNGRLKRRRMCQAESDAASDA